MAMLQLLGRPYGDQTHYWLGVAQLTSLALSFITYFSSGQPAVTCLPFFVSKTSANRQKLSISLCIQEENFMYIPDA
jgi:hypothetical protein